MTLDFPIREDISINDLSVDQQELGKILLIASFTLFLLSLHAFYSVSDIEQDLQDLDGEMSQTSAVLNSDGFNSSLQALREVNALNVESKVVRIIEGMSEANEALGSLDQVEKNAESSKSTYQWLSLISLLCFVSRLVLFLMER
ncbi:MAG: hypothetical protein J07AB43_13110 [Candidatus Nanosalina sp. J07AB43]|nr:MAG: hypothetical protein J07AB43_13110 [Candidatus Nanosalina sp. J07AB43]